MSLSNENTDAPDVMNSNWKFYVLFGGSLLSHTINLNAFVLTPWICWVRALKDRKINFWLPFLMSGMSAFLMLTVPIDFPQGTIMKTCRLQFHIQYYHLSSTCYFTSLLLIFCSTWPFPLWPSLSICMPS